MSFKFLQCSSNKVLQVYYFALLVLNYKQLAKYPSVGRVSAMVLRCHGYLNTVVALDHWIILEYV